MYSRSLDPRRIPSTLPNHYGGSAFRSDGTPTRIPVRREHDVHKEPSETEEVLSFRKESDLSNELETPDNTERQTEESENENLENAVPASKAAPCENTQTKEEASDPSFFSRVIGNLLPGVREDDLLLILLIFLLSREEDNEDVLLLLALLLFGR